MITGTEHVDQRSAITFEKETDRVYSDVPLDILVVMNDAESDDDRVVTITKNAFLNQGRQPISQKCDVVVWNPWKEKAKTMPDFGDEEYMHMVCVEPGCVSECQRLAVDDIYTLEQTIQVTKIFCVD